MHFDAVGAGIEIEPPHRLQQGCRRDRSIKDARQIREQVEFAQRQADQQPRAPDPPVDQIDMQLARADLPRGQPPAAQQAGAARAGPGGKSATSGAA